MTADPWGIVLVEPRGGPLTAWDTAGDVVDCHGIEWMTARAAHDPDR